jgi:hypothetical protein
LESREKNPMINRRRRELMKELCGFILAANHADPARDVKKAEKEGISRSHIDVTDGHYTLRKLGGGGGGVKYGKKKNLLRGFS